MDFIPEKSEIQVSNIEIKGDAVLKSMIRDLGLNKHFQGVGGNRGGDRPQRRPRN